MATLEDLEGLLEDLDAKLDTLTAKVDEPKSVQRICMHCVGTGTKEAEPGGPISCPDCGGTGVVPRGRITKLTEE